MISNIDILIFISFCMFTLIILIYKILKKLNNHQKIIDYHSELFSSYLKGINKESISLRESINDIKKELIHINSKLDYLTDTNLEYMKNILEEILETNQMINSLLLYLNEIKIVNEDTNKKVNIINRKTKNKNDSFNSNNVQ